MDDFFQIFLKPWKIEKKKRERIAQSKNYDVNEELTGMRGLKSKIIHFEFQHIL